VIAHARLYLKKEKKKKSPSTPRGLLAVLQLAAINSIKKL
jgi:hypothetical protein